LKKPIKRSKRGKRPYESKKRFQVACRRGSGWGGGGEGNEFEVRVQPKFQDGLRKAQRIG